MENFIISKHLPELMEMVKLGFVNDTIHPENSFLRIYKYSRECQFENHWNISTMYSRGLVLKFDSQGNAQVISGGLKKFFNISELSGINGKPSFNSIYTENCSVTEKMDGSLLIISTVLDEPIISTQGSFTSDQVLKFKSMMDNGKFTYNGKNILDILGKGFTYYFEIIYPENKIVVDYDSLECISYLCKFKYEENYGFVEYALDKNERSFFISCENVIFPEEYHGIGIDAIMMDESVSNKLNFTNKKGTPEGFVVRFSNGERCKIKLEKYVNLHRTKDNISFNRIFEFLYNGGSINEFKFMALEEFHNYIDACGGIIDSLYDGVDKESEILLSEWLENYVKMAVDMDMNKFLGTIYNKHKMFNIIMSKHRNREYSQSIWKYLKHSIKNCNFDDDIKIKMGDTF